MELIYELNEESYVDLLIRNLHYKSKHILKCIFLSLIPTIIFTILCIARYKYDIEEYGYLSEKSSPIILVYIICGVLWVILLPILYTKIKSMIFAKEVENLGMNYGEVKIVLSEEGILIKDNILKLKCSWNRFISYKQCSKFICIQLLEKEEYLIPIEAFKEQDKVDEFIKYIDSMVVKEVETNKEV